MKLAPLAEKPIQCGIQPRFVCGRGDAKKAASVGLGLDIVISRAKVGACH